MEDGSPEPELLNVTGRTETWGVMYGDRRVVVMTMVLEDGLPPDLKEAIVRVRESTIKGECPCGNSIQVDEASGRGWVAHSPHCPAEDRNFLRLAKKYDWRWSPE